MAKKDSLVGRIVSNPNALAGILPAPVTWGAELFNNLNHLNLPILTEHGFFPNVILVPGLATILVEAVTIAIQAKAYQLRKRYSEPFEDADLLHDYGDAYARGRFGQPNAPTGELHSGRLRAARNRSRGRAGHSH